MSGHNTRRFYQLHYKQVADGKMRRMAKEAERHMRWLDGREDAMMRISFANWMCLSWFGYCVFWSALSILTWA